MLAMVFVLACEPDGPAQTDTGTVSGAGEDSVTASGGESMTGATSNDSSSSGSEGGSGGAGTDACHGTTTCDAGFCVAPYADNDRGPFACVDACVEAGDEARWCYDDDACCDPAASCTIRGYCVVEGSSSSSSSGDAGSSSGSDSGSGSSG